MRTGRFWELTWVSALGAGFVGATLAVAGVGTTIQDFFLPGTQPNSLFNPIQSAIGCANCHAFYDTENEPFTPWNHSMMGQAARDPIFHACLAIANQDASFAGDLCLRCHVPQGWLHGRSSDPTGGALVESDFQGVGCSVCHRMVDPVYRPGESPVEDQFVLALHSSIPDTLHSGTYVIDPYDRRRGPYALDITPHQWLQSGFHRSSTMCATCHDVSNPAFTRQQDGTYTLNALDTPHPSENKYDHFPLERTFSEWQMSAFAQAPIDMQGRFGGNNPLVSTCQDCHMPKGEGFGADPIHGPTFRTDLHRHEFNGANTWVLRAVDSLYFQGETWLNPDHIEASIERAREMLRRASDLELSQDGATLTARIINQSGHKLPTGYPEGRRMWVNVKFFDAGDTLIEELGHYDDGTAVLTHDTKVYEAVLGADAAVAAVAGVPEGPGFHFAVNNVWHLDNRIPPRGFTNAAFASVQAAPVNYTYADGQHWDDSAFTIPPGAYRAEVRVFHQTTTKEYIEFLRDENRTNTAGQIAYDQWVLHGKSAPVEMDFASITLGGPWCDADVNCDGSPDQGDVACMILAVAGDTSCICQDPDFNLDGSADQGDVAALIGVVAGQPCP